MSLRPVVVDIQASARSWPDKPALVCGSVSTSYAELAARIVSTARWLCSMGVQPGDRVVVAAEAQPSFVGTYLACHSIEAIAVPVDVRTKHAQLDFIVEQTRPRLTLGFGSERAIEPGSMVDGLATERAGQSDPERISLDAAAEIVFTTGTSGRPKGVVLTNRNIAAAAANINQFVGNSHGDREALVLPLSHSFGLGRLRCNLILGATVVLVTEGLLHPDRLFAAIELHRASGFALVPSGVAVLLHLTGDRLAQYASQLAYVEIGSQPMPYELKMRLMRLLPKTRLCMHYGLTEASRSTFLEFHSSRKKLQTAGRPSPGVDVRVVDDGGREVQDDVPGQIVVRGETVMKEYWNDPAGTQRAIVGGWLHTGDVGHRDADGYIHIRGRQDEIINVGGLKVSPTEVEEVLRGHPGIEECACIGVPDPKGLSGQLVKAYLVARREGIAAPALDDLARFAAERLESYKVPAVFEWTDAIPRTPSGKPLRRRLAGQKPGG